MKLRINLWERGVVGIGIDYICITVMYKEALVQQEQIA